MLSVIVTGGSRGIGLGIVRRLAASGFHAIAVARNPSPGLTEVAAAADASQTGLVSFQQADLGQIDAVPALVRGLRKRHGPIFGLVNNAASGTAGLLATMQNPHIEALVRVNTLAPIILTKYVVRNMMADGGGRIVNISSIVAATGFNALSVYGATKAALVGFTRSLAREVGAMNITVNAIAPGFIDTEMTQGLGDTGRDKIARRSALRRLAEVDDVANTVDFLLGEGGRNITGTVLTVDAGNTA